MNIAKSILEAEQRLPILDPKLGALIAGQEPFVYSPRDDYFYSLCRAIVGQQVSVAAASSIFQKLENATGMQPSAVMALTAEQTKAIGLSGRKVGYLRDLAAHFVDNPNIYNHLDKRSDEQVLDELTAVKGIGTWTAQMFLMFTLARLDVFAPDDVGLQRAMKTLYGWESVPPKIELEAVADRWRPYRTVACWHLWKSLHNTPN